MTVVAYAICRQCAAVFPADRRCPRCDGDVAAAEAIATATAHAMEPAAQRVSHRHRPGLTARVLLPVVGVAALMIGLGAGLAWLIVNEADADATTMSSSNAADR